MLVVEYHEVLENGKKESNLRFILWFMTFFVAVKNFCPYGMQHTSHFDRLLILA